MSLIREELERLARALDELDTALAERDERQAASIAAALSERDARLEELAAARDAARVDTDVLVERVDRTIARLETVLNR